MAVVGVAYERPDSPDGDFALGKHTFTRTFRVETDSYADGPLVVTAASGVPLLFSNYATANESHAYALCRNIRARRIASNSLFWEVVCQYETPELASGTSGTGSGGQTGSGGATRNENAEQFENPLLELPDIEFHVENFTRPIERIFNRDSGEWNAPRSSAGEVFDKAPERDDGRLVLTISRNEAIGNVHPALGELYRFAVNSDTFWGRPPGTVRVEGIVAKRQTKQLPSGSVYAFLRVTYVVKFKDDWDIYLLDQGTYELEQRGTGDAFEWAKKAFPTDDGHPMKRMLDGHGQKQPDFVHATIVGDVTSGSSIVSVAANTTVVRVGDRVDGPGLGAGIPVPYVVASKTASSFDLNLAAQFTDSRGQYTLWSSLSVTGNTTVLSRTLTSVSDTSGVFVGDAVSGDGVPSGSVVVSKTVNTIVLNNPATATANTVTFTVSSQRVVAGDTTAGSVTVATGGVTTGVRVGDRVTGTNIQDETFVLAVTATQFSLSRNATGTGSAVELTLERLPDPVYLRLRPYQRLPFSVLDLPQSFTEAR